MFSLVEYFFFLEAVFFLVFRKAFYGLVDIFGEGVGRKGVRLSWRRCILGVLSVFFL